MTNASLGNTFVPKIPSSLIAKILSQISSNGLANLCLLWSSIKQTQPIPSDEQQSQLNITNEQLLTSMINYVQDFKKKTNPIKRKLIDKILVDFYPNGLNLLQFAQLDSQLLIEKPMSFYWQFNKLLNSRDLDHVINLNDPQSFLNNLVLELSQFYLNHIYISRHPNFPLIIIRIQLFDLINGNISNQNSLTTSNSIISRKPFFVALPLNSSNIISSFQSSTDLASNIILQSIESALSKTLSIQLRLNKPSVSQPPIRSLESLHIIKGNSRFAESLGVWAPYADGTIDISPFDDVNNHQVFEKIEKRNRSDDDEVDWDRLSKIAMLRFKGTLKGLKSEKLYEDPNDYGDSVTKKRKIEDLERRNIDRSKYSSLTPIQMINFEINNEYNGFKPSVKIKLNGMDVFGGLHELCDEGIINPETIPGWLTGEEGSKPGVIIDDVFYERNDPQLRNSDLI